MITEWQEKANQGWQLTCTAQKHIDQDHFDFDLDAHHDHDLVRLG